MTEERPSYGAVLWEAMQAASPLIAREPNWEDQPTANQVYLNQLADAVAAAVRRQIAERLPESGPECPAEAQKGVTTR